MPETFPRQSHRLRRVPVHIVRTDAEPIVSYLGYIGVPCPYRCIAPRHGGRKKTYDWRKSTYTGGKEPVRYQDSAISVPTLRERR